MEAPAPLPITGPEGWLQAFAWLSWALSAAMWVFLGESWAYVMAAIGAFLVLLVPGLVMMRAEPSKVV